MSRNSFDHIRHARWRLRAIAAAGTLLLTGLGTAQPAHAGPDACTTVGTTTTCQGNQSAGIADPGDFPAPPVTTLNVNTLTQNIAPAAGMDGIFVLTNTPFILNLDTGSFQILITNTFDDGVQLETVGVNNPLTVHAAGTIMTTANFSEAINIRTDMDNSPLILRNQAALSTTGNSSDAIRAETDGANSPMTVRNDGPVTTSGPSSQALRLDTSGMNSPLMVTNHGPITTTGSSAQGMLLDTFDPNSALTVYNYGPITTSANGSEGIDGTTQDPNSPLTVHNRAPITTAGSNANAIQVNTIGSNSTLTLNNHAAVVTTGSSSEGLDTSTVGDGSPLIVMNYGPVTTSDDFSQAIETNTGGPNSPTTVHNHAALTTSGSFAHSIESDSSDTNNPLTAHNHGPITTSGTSANGIDLESRAVNSPITVNNWANVTASGSGAEGISTDARAFDGITINLLGGTVQGGTGSAAGVLFVNGRTNRLDISSGASVWALSGLAISGGTGDETVNNYGTVTGNVLLGAGMNAFNNKTGGVFNSGMTVDLGAGNLLLNYGILSPGGTGSFQTTTQTMGNFRQDPGGTFLVDVDFAANQSDRFTVAAPGTASLAGSVKVNLVNPLNIQPLQQQMPVTIFTAASGVTNMGITVVDTGVVDYTLIFPNATDVQLTALLNYAPAGLNLNQTALGLALNAIQTAGAGAPIAPLLGQLVLLPSLAALQGAYDTILPALYGNSLVTSLVAATLFADSLLSCREREGAHAIIAEGECLWFQAQGRFFDHDRTAQQIGFDETSGSFSAGGQVALGQYWRASAAVGYETSYVETSTAAEAETDRVHVGGALKYQRGAGLIAAAVSGGYGWVDSLRRVQALGFAAQPRGDTENHYVSGRLRGAWAFEGRHAYLKPLVDVAVTHVEQDGFTETGGGIANLVVGDIDETSISVSPALELGLEKQTRNGTLIRPFVRAGITAFDDDDVRVTAQFAAVTAGLAPFTTTTGFDDVLVDISAGADLIGTDGATLKAFYDGQFGDDTEHHAAGLKGSIPLGRRALK